MSKLCVHNDPFRIFLVYPDHYFTIRLTCEGKFNEIVLLHMAGCYVNVGFEFCANKSADASRTGSVQDSVLCTV